MQSRRAGLDSVNRDDPAKAGDDRILRLIDSDKAAAAQQKRARQGREHQDPANRTTVIS